MSMHARDMHSTNLICSVSPREPPQSEVRKNSEEDGST